MGLSPSPVGSDTILRWMGSELDKLLDTQLVSENYMMCGKPACLVSEVVSMCGARVRRDSHGTGKDLIAEDPALGSPREVNLCSWQVVSASWWWVRVW